MLTSVNLSCNPSLIATTVPCFLLSETVVTCQL